MSSPPSAGPISNPTWLLGGLSS
ncbi:hypothetical protein CLIM01_13456 [Colletotrichum limetticola]|uniref:Uncharacterized protein n=1 Tax=Colletotrichum limetticola TaxID=1209924 RepID=A0ABQ9PCA7_9PEZI|nr:hypothetical protein CLIM01_13456 [Colletotrichum limetticola]